MPARYIYFPKELSEKLDEEENISALIQGLLREHYESETSPKDKLEVIKKEIEKKITLSNELETQITNAEEKKSKIIQSSIQEEEQKEISEERQHKIKLMYEEAFMNYEINPEQLNNMINEFLELYKDKKVNNIIEYMQQHNIKHKVRKRILI